MAKYIVVKNFRDLERKGKLYKSGQPYEVEGLDEERITFLSNPIEALDGEPAIKKVNDESFPKHTGGGWYELSNGERLRGKEEAIQAENELM